jgi:hypothetical protein
LLSGADIETGTRKLRCSGESPSCSRCLEDSISCIYSPRKKMGRPRKRSRTGVEVSTPSILPAVEPTLDPFPNESITPSIPWALDEISFLSYVNSPVCIPQPAPAQPLDHSNLTTCNCIATTSSALQLLQSLTTFHFPSSLGYLRNILSSLTPVVDCPLCPQQRSTALQNIMLLQTTLTSIAERFQGLLSGLEDEYRRLESSGERPQLRIADPSVDISLHSGTADCPMGFTLAIDPSQWRELARKSLMSLINGPGSTFKELIKGIEERQQNWHADLAKQQWGAHENGGYCWRPPQDTQEGPRCVANLRHILSQIESIG